MLPYIRIAGTLLAAMYFTYLAYRSHGARRWGLAAFVPVNVATLVWSVMHL
jgi:hypothetical protein